MKKITEKLYNYFKKKYLKNLHDYDKIFMQAYIETYKTNAICLIRLCGVDWEQFQLDKESIIRYTVWVKSPGMFIGWRGKCYDKMVETLKEYIGKVVDINIREV